MPAFFSGDELGQVKHTYWTRSEEGWKPTSTVLSSAASEGKGKAVQKLVAFTQADNQVLLAAARADATASILALSTDHSSAELVCEWKETRLKSDQRYVGLAATSSGIYSCTSNGALRLTKPNGEETPESHLAAAPMRLTEWRLSSNGQTFSYAGDEVEVSVWNTERAFAEASTASKTATSVPAEDTQKKRKRPDATLPGEIWRAKNLPNDELNLRQPVRDTALTYLRSSSNPAAQQLLVGTQFGDIRRYDTRAARRPVSNWKGSGKTGGIGVIEVGSNEHEIFVSDKGVNLFAMDLRNGAISYGYKGIRSSLLTLRNITLTLTVTPTSKRTGLAGAVTSIAVSSSYLASTSQDRYLRLHSTFPPPPHPGQQQYHKGEVLDKFYMTAIPTAVVPDSSFVLGAQPSAVQGNEGEDDDGEDDDAVWAGMEDAESDEGEGTSHKKRKTKSVRK
ncbi:hypothetical protein BXZ70DRAFT_242916 [Cristinia sonorae]|uniref:Ribosome biogenesis protein NSA1 n=1 Tax=Cristinia sonorae TaxID=1940300 RepID=A0A8K0XTW8_9AGAR|nr:hypothetical protein BXZ70DRAFT_242916 [Cristinia sonorae]